jgi:hypothetical protein
VSEAVLVFLLAMLAFLVFWPLFTGVRGKWNTRNSIFRILHITSSQSHKELAPGRIRAW